MAQTDHTASTEELRRELIIHFLADIMRATIESKTPEAFQSALQAYCDDLCPWVEFRDCPSNPRAVFSLLENCTYDATGEHMTVVLSPEAEAFFRAWLRRNQILNESGFNTAHAWSN
jgi:hypothetical protein